MTVDKAIPILVVDDYKTMIRIIKNLLNQLGFKNVDDATNCNMALSKLQEKNYAIVIADWNMEPMNGLDLFKKTRTDEKFKTTKFILVTSESKPEEVIAAKEAGINNFIVKPFNIETLKSNLEKILGVFLN
ncbi:MAG: response regulator [Sphingobacteriia bacterium]|nr:response regulator [Sphingobacteriia bacterium]